MTASTLRCLFCDVSFATLDEFLAHPPCPIPPRPRRTVICRNRR